jgi:hypothetical protein
VRNSPSAGWHIDFDVGLADRPFGPDRAELHRPVVRVQPDLPHVRQQRAVNEPYVRLLARITAAGSGPPVLRVGAGAADNYWWNPSGAPRPRGILFDVHPDYFDALRLLQRATGSPLILDLNMAADEPRLAVDLAREAMGRLDPGTIQAFEIGNEPDIYATRGFGDGFARPSSWSFDDYLGDFARFRRALDDLSPRPLLAAPDACCSAAFDEGLPRLLRREKRSLALVTYHQYPLPGCYGGASERDATPQRLFADEHYADTFRRFFPLVRAARAAGLKLRVTETNTSACGWMPDGLSGTFAPALWAPDWMFSLVFTGVAGVNFHASGVMNPVRAGFTSEGRYFVSAPPLYYGLLIFARATANRARLLPQPSFRARPRARSHARVWVTVDRDHVVRALVIAESATEGGVASIQIPGARDAAGITRLTAPGLDATTGVKLGGQAVAQQSFDGRLEGEPRRTYVHPRHGSYRFDVPPASAALLTVKAPAGR